MFCVASVLEGFCEPFFILAQKSMRLNIRVYSEALSTIIRVTATYYMVLSENLLFEGILAYGYGALIYSVSLFFLYLVQFFYHIASTNFIIDSMWEVYPRPITYQNGTSQKYNYKIKRLALSFTFQSWFKHVLTE
eukprot:Awhi_evm1s5261